VTLLQILVVLAVVGAVAAVAAGVWRRGEPVEGAIDLDHRAAEVGLPEPTSTLPLLQLPDGRLTAEDVDRLRFSTGLRGYRMDEVDLVLDRVSAELRDRQAEVEELRDQLSARTSAAGPPTSDLGPAQPGQDVGES
jgi:DivIVA domain-containing protein